MLRINYLLLLLGSFAFLSSCNNDGWKTSESGMQYRISKDSTGENIKTGDIVQMHVKYTTAKDSVLFNSFSMPQPVTMEVPPSQFKGSFEEALGMLSSGDSAQFKIPADSIFRKEMGASRPAFIDSGSLLTFTVKILKSEKKDDFNKRVEKEKAESAGKQIGIDEALIAGYIAEKGLKPTKTEKGVYIQITKEGNGPQAEIGDSVKVNYTGKTLDGKVFDSSRKEDGGLGSTFDFVLGVTPIIAGWQDGIAQMKQGSRATLVIPSGLAYGDQATPRFGANSVLAFDVEVVKVIKSKK